MSEMRQRKGAPAASNESKDGDEKISEEERQRFSETIHAILAERVVKSGRATTKEEIDRCVAEDLEKMSKGETGPLPGIKNETKKAKDALMADPYSLEKIMALGDEYRNEEKWTEAMNVMARGWKRVAAPKGKGEIESPEGQFAFLFTFMEASMHCKKFRQAEHVLRDIEQFCMPQEAEDLRDFYCADCKVNAELDKMQKTLEAFKLALNQCESFDEKASVWFRSSLPLKKVGADKVAKNIIENSAESEEDKKKLEKIDMMNDLKEKVDQIKPRGTPNSILLGVAAVLFCLIIYILWWLEQKSLQSLKLTTPP